MFLCIIIIILLLLTREAIKSLHRYITHYITCYSSNKVVKTEVKFT